MALVRISPIHPSLGAEVTDVDLGAPIDGPTRHTLSRALADHLALVFHDQSLTPAAYLAAASIFGPPMEQHYSQHNMADVPLTPEASRSYMRDLLDRMIRPEIVYHHVWRKGDVLVIDDRATMHRAHGDYDRSQSRVLWRIIVEGDRPRLA